METGRTAYLIESRPLPLDEILLAVKREAAADQQIGRDTDSPHAARACAYKGVGRWGRMLQEYAYIEWG